jgi:tripartite-type tricarboxylate transporter receptor subunit TctC
MKANRQFSQEEKTMSRTARILALLLLSVVGTGQSFAQTYPAKSIHIIVPFPAGGAADIAARLIGQKVTEAWGQPVVVEDRPGGNTVIGAEAVARAAPDGYNLLWVIDSTLVMNQSLYSKLSYDPIRDFAPITRTITSRQFLIVDANTGPKSVKELLQQARANPGKLNFGAGTLTNQLAGLLFNNLAGLDIVYVPYKGSPPTVQGLLSGDVTMIIDGFTTSLPHIKSGRFRVLANLSLDPIAALPNVPTVADEAGLPGFDVVIWQGMVAPAGTSPDIVNRWHREVVRIFSLPEIRAKLTAMGQDLVTCTPAEFAVFIRSEAERWAKVIKQAGIRLE